ncbi:hypothetical protein [uncultured Roseobacter sp.]|uniref:hypothetical protein n=1 Tax=uncultured Roseobacter sp. TaxID=114847 RepID=UPI002612987D|nr:hypothetical protein [uncultured Roseobacter sp.]
MEFVILIFGVVALYLGINGRMTSPGLYMFGGVLLILSFMAHDGELYDLPLAIAERPVLPDIF